MAIDLNKRHYNKYGEKIITQTEPQKEEIFPESYPREKINIPEAPRPENYPQMKIYPQNEIITPAGNPLPAAVPRQKKPPVILRILAGLAGAFLIWFFFFLIVGIIIGINEGDIGEYEPDIDNYNTYAFAAKDIGKITADIPYSFVSVYVDSGNYSDEINVTVNCEEDFGLQLINENGELKIISDISSGEDYSYTYNRYIDICLPYNCGADISLYSDEGKINCQDIIGGKLTVDSTESDISLYNCNFENADISASGEDNSLNVNNCTGEKITLGAGSSDTYISFLAARELYIDCDDYLSLSDTYIDGPSEIHADNGYFQSNAFIGDTKIGLTEDVSLTSCQFSGDLETESLSGGIYLTSCSVENASLKAESSISADICESKKDFTVIKNGVRERTGEYTILLESGESESYLEFDGNKPDITEAVSFAERFGYFS